MNGVWILVLLAAVAGGAGLASPFERRSAIRMAVGAPVGLAVLGLVGFLLSCLFGLTPGSVAAASFVAGAPALLLWPRAPRRRGRVRVRRCLLLAAAALACACVLDRAAYERADGIYTGDNHNLGDLPFHIAVVTSFAKAGNFPPEHPELLGARLTYPFLVDFVAAVLVRAGARLRDALLAENLTLSVALLVLLYRFGLRLTRDPRAALLTPLFVVLSGGLGFWRLGPDAVHDPDGLIGLLRHLPHDYTITSTGELRWGNAVTTLLIPQRALLLGIPLAVAAWTLWWRALQEPGEAKQRTRLMAAAGAVTALLPLAHAHAFVLTLGMGIVLAWLFPDRTWMSFFACALLLAAPQILLVASGSAVRPASFVGWQPGWDSGGRSPLWFWLTNTGLFLPLLAVGLWRGRPRRLVRFTAPFLLLFVVPNLLRLSPWIWDNIKFLFFWYLASVPLVARVVARLSRRGAAGLLAAVALAVVLTLSGALDVWRVASGQTPQRIFDADGIALAADLLDATPPRSVILHAPTYDSPVYLSGRRSVLGYPGHIPSQGLDAGDREAELGRIYAGAPDADALLSRYGVDFILVGPAEAPLHPNEEFLSRFPVVGQRGPYGLRAVR